MTAPFSEFRKDEINQSIPDRFEKQVARYPNRPAIKTGKDELNYTELNRAANRIAQLILNLCGEGEEAVVLMMEQSSLLIAAILGVLKAGKIYVPVDPSLPSDRMYYMKEDSGASLILTDSKNFPIASKIAGGSQVFNIDCIPSRFTSGNPGLPISPDAIAYILYTSGSTGQPKGVYQTHRNALHNIMKYINSVHISADDRLTLLYSCSFAASVSNIFGALLNGASLFSFDLKEKGAHRLPDWLVKEDITIYHSVPTVFRHFISSLNGKREFPRLRLIRLGGEHVCKKDFEIYKKHFHEKCIFLVALGSTEMNLIRQFFCDHQTVIDSNIIPVGYAVPDTDILILNENGEDLGHNSEGEIAIRSRYLSPGYWKKPELTKASFVPDPAGENNVIYRTGDYGYIRDDGCLTLLGRKDSRLKIRGYRVETTEVEAVLQEIAGVNEAVVIGRESQNGDKRLAAYLIMNSHPVPTIDELRIALKQKLPDYMIPSDFISLDSLPLTPSGKIDRRSLPEPDSKRPELMAPFVAPRDEVEIRISKICEKILNIHPVGVKDNLIDLGMDSIMYFNLILEIEKKINKSLPLEIFHKAYTVADIADVFRGKREISSPAAIQHNKSKTSAHPFNFNPGLRLKKIMLMPWGHVKFAVLQLAIYALPYPAGIKFLSWYCGRQWAHNIFFGKKVHLVKQFLLHIKSRQKTDDIVKTSLMGNSFVYWIYGSLARRSSMDLNKWVTITGIKTLQESHQKGNGVILLASHVSLSSLPRLILHQNGFDDILIIARGAKPDVASKLLGLTGSGHVRLELKKDNSFFLKSLSMAAKTLERGGIVLVAGDGYQGESGVYIPFHGRTRIFRAGFAELAINTGADIIPSFIFMNAAGQIKVEFFKPLNSGMPEMSRRDTVIFLIREYAKLLEKKWAEYPDNINLIHLERFLSLPKA